MTRPILRPQAEVDLVERAHYYREEGGSDLGEVCGIDGLGVRRIPNFPCGWFYFASGDRVDVVRLLADDQDIAAVFADMEQE